MEELLYLVHRIPYPPNKGDKIRSFHLLKHLAQRYRVHVGAFVDDPHDWRYEGALRELAGGEVKLLPLDRRLATLKSTLGLLCGEPLTLSYYRDARMTAWVGTLLAARPVRRALVYSSSMAPYLMRHEGIRRVIDFVDIDSDKWRQYAENKPWPLSWVYWREARTLFAFERRVSQAFDASAFVSEAEAQHFKRLAPDCAAKVFGFSNGVDTDYFDPAKVPASPYAPAERAIVFTGAMDYWANVDAVVWFVDKVFPRVLAAQPKARFYIVGARPTAAVQALARQTGVVITGAVADIRPYLAHAALAVAPLRIARGIQNKVLEAMAMGRPTVVSPQALEGIEASVGRELVLARDATEFVQRCIGLLAAPDPALGVAARARVLADYSWNQHLRGLDAVLAAEAPEAHPPPPLPTLRETLS